jgi:hypothetical protein
MNVLEGIFLNSRKDRRKDGVFFVRCRRTYVINNYFNNIFRKNKIGSWFQSLEKHKT